VYKALDCIEAGEPVADARDWLVPQLEKIK
jgi:hypothetical protein